ncbi:MAG: ERF family protein [Acetobacteraceae bacterium]|nr:ERF family protein [Acetobacteraceae bacterium]
MNEIVRDQEADLPRMSPVDLRSYCDHNSKMRESTDISKIAPALVRAQAMMENPVRNRSVQVRTQAGSYQFRYATLDKITDLVRRALAENGLCVLQPIISTERGAALVTRLLHESGQWMECEILLPPLGSNPQAFGSAVTYMRRYSISAMLNISADEDDDANRAAGNHYQDLPARKERNPRQPREEATDLGEVVGDAVARTLVNRARLAEGVEEGHALLEAWLQRATVLEKLRGTKAWDSLERELGAGLKRSLGVEPAAAFITALRASEPQHIATLQQHWEGKWAGTLSAMQQEAPATYAMLRRHVAAQIARVRAMTAEEPAPAPAAPAFRAQLKDAAGEVVSGPITDAVAFAEAYAEAWRGVEPEMRAKLARNNVRALGQAAKDATARAVLDRLSAAEAAAEPQPAG